MSQPGDNATRKRSRRWLQISVRTLLVMMTLAAVAAGAWRWYTEPFRRQRQAMEAIEKAGGSYETVPGGSRWIRSLLGEGAFQNIVHVNVADCDDPSAYLDYVIDLPALQRLIVRGPVFKDEHLRRLQKLTDLQRLVLDCSKVRANSVGALKIRIKDWNDLRSEMRYHTGVTTAGINELRQALPNCEVAGIVLMF